MDTTRIDDNEALKNRIKSDMEPQYELAQEFTRQFREATINKRTTKVGDYGLTELLHKCFEARDDRTTPQEQELRDRFPAWSSMPVSLVAYKVNILVALIRESLVDIANAPFIVDPTPRPTLPESDRDRIITEAEEKILQVSRAYVEAQQAFVAGAVNNGMASEEAANSPNFPKLDSTEVYNYMREQKAAAYRKIKEQAKDEAKKLEDALYDKTTEGGYAQALIEFADDFATYPFACIHGPVPTMCRQTEWVGDEFKEVEKLKWTFERVSPFDVFWTSDSMNTQNGTAVFIRKRVGVNYIYTCRDIARKNESSGYRLDAIENLIEAMKEDRIPRNWVDMFEENVEYDKLKLTWMLGDVVDIVIRYGQFHGFTLKDMGFADIDEEKLYETKTIMCGNEVIHCEINNNPSQYRRPVFTASFESRNNSIVGVGLGQKLLSLHEAYRSVTAMAMNNLGLSSQPIAEIDIDRVVGGMPDGWKERPTIRGGQVFAMQSDRASSGAKAIRFTEVPNVTNEMFTWAEYIKNEAHEISNIPAALHGQPVGSGANRTVRGLLTLQGNVLKPIQSSLTNLDNGIIKPMITLLYILLITHDEDFDYAGDCTIIPKGAASMIEREVEKQDAMENLQVVGQLGPYISPEILQRVVERLLQLAGILEPGERAIPTDPVATLQQQMAAAQGQQPQQGMAAQPGDLQGGIPGQAPQAEPQQQPQQQSQPIN